MVKKNLKDTLGVFFLVLGKCIIYKQPPSAMTDVEVNVIPVKPVKVSGAH